MKLLGMEALSSVETARKDPSFKALPSLYIPYFDQKGKPLSPQPKHPPFFRIRYLSKPNDFSKATGKARRYSQPPNSGICAYFPRSCNWQEFFDDLSFPLLITEGEFKAACATKFGFPTIGLGGVYNWRSAKKGIPFLPELEKVPWVKRNVHIVFDSDFKNNAQVCKALNDLAEELYERGAYPHMVSLPEVKDNGKTGLDDFLVQEGERGMFEVIGESQPITLSKTLWALNEKVIYVQDPGLVINIPTGQKMSPGAFKEHAFSTANTPERIVRANGSVSLKKVSAAASWLKWQHRAEAPYLTYAPGQPRITKDGLYNTWAGWGCEERRGDVSWFLKLVDHLFSNATAEAKRWFLRWCAYPIQNPGVKMFSAVVVHGVRHGTGKSLLGYSLGKIYGKNFTEINQEHLHSPFNEWAESKQFVLGDDVTGSDRRADADMLKKLITQKELRVNVKYVPSFVVPDRINYYFTSNHPDAFFLEDDDRRFFIHEVDVSPLDQEFYAGYDLWLDSKLGPAALRYYLNHLDLGDFNPSAPALQTDAKSRMITDVKSDLGSWVQSLREDPDNALRIGDIIPNKDLYTNAELLQIYDPSGETRTTPNGLGRELKRAGFFQVNEGRLVRGADGENNRYYAVRNLSKWRNATIAKIRAHLRVGNTKTTKEKKY